MNSVKFFLPLIESNPNQNKPYRNNRKHSKSLSRDFNNEIIEKNNLNIVEANIDPSDWLNEFNQVKKYLELSNDQIDGKVNLNDIFDPKSRLNIISNLSGYFSKARGDKSFNNLSTLSFEVDRSLKNISLFEKKISQNAEKKVFKNGLKA